MKTLTILFLLGTSLGWGQTPEARIAQFNLKKSIAIEGYDPVSYFDNKPLEGKNELSLINGKSGQIVWSIDSFNKGVKVDYRNSLIHQFLIGYVRYSLKTGEVLNRNVNREYYSEIEIESQRSNYALGVDHIYTTDWKKGIIGAFCLNKLKFDWIYRIKTGNFPATAKLVWITPYLLVKDSNNNLYVFKEKDSTLLQVSNS